MEFETKIASIKDILKLYIDGKRRVADLENALAAIEQQRPHVNALVFQPGHGMCVEISMDDGAARPFFEQRLHWERRLLAQLKADIDAAYKALEDMRPSPPGVSPAPNCHIDRE